MVNSITFDNFRGFKHLDMPDMMQITLISGKNNAGKTSVLEGIFLAADHTASESFSKMNMVRGLPTASEPSKLWGPLFYAMNTNNKISICVEIDSRKCFLTYQTDSSFTSLNNGTSTSGVVNQVVSTVPSLSTLGYNFKRGSYSEKGSFYLNSLGIQRNVQTTLENDQIEAMPFLSFMNAAILGAYNDNIMAEWLGKIELEDKRQQIIDILKVMEPELQDIFTVLQQNQIQIYSKVNGNRLPLKLAGDGMNRLLYIVLAITTNPNTIILIDEIETGFHYSMHSKIWKVLATAAKESNCQIIATTHSYECIDSAVDGVKDADMAHAFCYYRIERIGEETKAIRFSNDLLRYSLENNMEVR